MLEPSVATVQGLAAYLNGVTVVGPETATTLLTMVEESSLAHASKMELVGMLQVKTDLGLAAPLAGENKDKQVHNYFHEYL